MGQAFVIMQIGNPDLENVFEKAIVPAIVSCGLDPKRVDKHNEGRLLKSEIVKFIESADIIISDLTNERPNCYLEVGYAMGLDKFRNLILTAREDHYSNSSNYKKGGPKVHFDLSGYDILYWNPGDIDGFKKDLQKRINRRLATLPSQRTSSSPWDEEWISIQQETALAGLKRTGKSAFMEIRMALPDHKLNASQTEILHAAEEAAIHTFGWPLGVVSRRDDAKPRPKADGIVAEIFSKDGGAYDYWAIQKYGEFYLLKSLFEDERNPEAIFFNTRIIRITEALLYCVRLYSSLKVPLDCRVLIGIAHGGLKDRVLAAVGNRMMLRKYHNTAEDNVFTVFDTVLDKIEPDLINIVEAFIKPLFVVFDFFEVDKNTLEDIVNQFVSGKCT